MDASKPVAHDQSDRDEADELRAEVGELRVKVARFEERLNASERREMDLQIRLADLRAEREQLAFDLAQARKPWAVRVLEALRRR
jgi:chromosome segregation ATPase